MLSRLLGINYQHVTRNALNLQPPIQPSVKPFKWSEQHPLNVHLAVRLVTYGSMGLVVVLLAPYTFTLLAI